MPRPDAHNYKVLGVEVTKTEYDEFCAKAASMGLTRAKALRFCIKWFTSYPEGLARLNRDLVEARNE